MRAITRLLDQLLPALLIAAAITLLAAGLLAYINPDGLLRPGTSPAESLSASPSELGPSPTQLPSGPPSVPPPTQAHRTPLAVIGSPLPPTPSPSPSPTPAPTPTPSPTPAPTS